MADNQRKKILIASPFFYPEPISTGKYSTFLAEKLVEKDHDVTVICSYPFYPAWQPKFTRKTLAGVRIMRGA
jgi:colanic acid biosynthesis glycosyl transferase WcaI